MPYSNSTELRESASLPGQSNLMCLRERAHPATFHDMMSISLSLHWGKQERETGERSRGGGMEAVDESRSRCHVHLPAGQACCVPLHPPLSPHIVTVTTSSACAGLENEHQVQPLQSLRFLLAIPPPPSLSPSPSDFLLPASSISAAADVGRVTAASLSLRCRGTEMDRDMNNTRPAASAECITPQKHNANAADPL